MADYTTRTLAEKLMPAAADSNIKAATRTLRKFLRDELGNGHAVVGKGNRYALKYNAKEITSLKKKFDAWQVAQAEAQAARRALLDAKKAPAIAPEVIEDAPADAPDDAEVEADHACTFESDCPDCARKAPEGPTDEEIAAMLDDTDIDA